MKEKGFLKDFWENLEEYLCSAALLVMTFVTFMNVFSRKITWFNMSFTQELVTTMFVWVCCLAAASVFKTDSHMGFNYLTDKFTGTGRKVYRICRLLLCSANYGIWIIWGAQMVYRRTVCFVKVKASFRFFNEVLHCATFGIDRKDGIRRNIF